ncbi:MAG: alpha/beta hydrolase [bacterium]
MKKPFYTFTLAFVIMIRFSIDERAQNSKSSSSGFINVGKDKLYYEVAGEGPAIIFIHDGLVHSAVWDEQFSYYSKDHRVIRYDRRGYGNSSAGTEEFSNLEDLNTLFDYLKVDNACLIGMSSGGRLAIDFTLQHPEKVTSLVLVGAVVGGFSSTKHFYTRGGHFPEGLKVEEQIREYYATKDPYEMYSGNAAIKEKILKLIKKFPAKGGHEFAKREQPGLPRLNEIKIPTLILVGEYDIPDVQAHAGAINAGIANSTREIILNAGHLVVIEQPEAFNKRLDEFLLDVKLMN